MEFEFCKPGTCPHFLSAGNVSYISPVAVQLWRHPNSMNSNLEASGNLDVILDDMWVFGSAC